LHSVGDDEALIAWDKHTGEVYSRLWCDHGEKHREHNLPAEIKRDADRTEYIYFKNGAETKYTVVSNKTGNTTQKGFLNYGPFDPPYDETYEDKCLVTLYLYDETTGEFISKKHTVDFEEVKIDDLSENQLPFPRPQI